MSDRQRGIAYIALSALGFAFLPTITRSLYVTSTFQPTDVGFWRFLLANAVIWAIVALRLRQAAARLPFAGWKVAALGVLYALSALAAFFGLQLISASLYVVLFYTYPAMVAIISLMLGVRLSVWAWMAVGMTIIGCVLTIPDFSFLQQGGNLVGVLTALFNALSVAIYYLVSSRWMRQAGDTLHATAWMMLSTFAVICIAVIPNGLRLPDSVATLALVVLLSTVSTVVPIFAINAGLRLIPPTQGSIISSIEPVMAMLIALVLLGEVIRPLQWVGAALIVAAVILLETSPKQKIQIPA